MRVIYAADNRYGSAHLLARFIDIIRPLPIELKVSAYRSSMASFSVDWTLDALTNNFIKNKERQSLTFNGNFDFLKLEIERYKPDLISSDLEVFTSLARIDTGMELWQVSPTLLYFALPKQTKINMGLSTKAKYVLYSNQRKKAAMEKVIGEAKKRLIVSHIADACDIEVDAAFEFVRPEIHFLSEDDRNDLIVRCEIEVADAFYNELPFKVIDDQSDLENMLVKTFANERCISINQSIKSLDEHLKARLQ